MLTVGLFFFFFLVILHSVTTESMPLDTRRTEKGGTTSRWWQHIVWDLIRPLPTANYCILAKKKIWVKNRNYKFVHPRKEVCFSVEWTRRVILLNTQPAPQASFNSLFSCLLPPRLQITLHNLVKSEVMCGSSYRRQLPWCGIETKWDFFRAAGCFARKVSVCLEARLVGPVDVIDRIFGSESIYRLKYQHPKSAWDMPTLQSAPVSRKARAACRGLDQKRSTLLLRFPFDPWILIHTIYPLTRTSRMPSVARAFFFRFIWFAT